MKTKALPTRQLCRLALFAALLAPAGNALAAPVTEQEALEIAEFWYAAEINHYDEQGWDRGPERKSDLLAAVQIISVRYLVEKDTIVDKLKRKQQVLAYIIEFAPRGYLVLAADDSITPLLAFNIDSQFSWDNPEGGSRPSFMRLFLNGYVSDARVYFRDLAASGAADQVHSGWLSLRSLAQTQKNLDPVEKSFLISSSGSAIAAMGGTPDPSSAEVLLPTPTWGQGGFYNDAVTDSVYWVGGGNPPGDFPENVPTGCNATALAILLRYHEWPIRITGTHEWYDVVGDVWGSAMVHPNVVFSWDQMPTYNITSKNDHIAWLMARTGALTYADWEINSTAGNNPGQWNDQWEEHLSYRDDVTEVVEAYSPTPLPESNCSYDRKGGHDYFFCPNEKTLEDAWYACYYAGMNLLRIDNSAEADFIAAKMDDLGLDEARLGASDYIEGEWRWADNGDQFWQGRYDGYVIPGFYANWYYTQPDDTSHAQNCAAIRSDFDHQWSDDGCNWTIPYICERPVDPYLILDDIRDSIVRGLPVQAGVEWYNPTGFVGHSVIIDGYREIVPPGADLDSFLSVNDGSGGASAWHNVYSMTSGGIGLLTAGRVFFTPEIYVYVDPSYTGSEDGGPLTPYDTIAEGISNIPQAGDDNPKGGRLWLRAGYYAFDSPLVFEDPMEIVSYLGNVSLKNKLVLNHTGYIRISSGQLTINP